MRLEDVRHAIAERVERFVPWLTRCMPHEPEPEDLNVIDTPFAYLTTESATYSLLPAAKVEQRVWRLVVVLATGAQHPDLTGWDELAEEVASVLLGANLGQGVDVVGNVEVGGLDAAGDWVTFDITFETRRVEQWP